MKWTGTIAPCIYVYNTSKSTSHARTLLHWELGGGQKMKIIFSIEVHHRVKNEAVDDGVLLCELTVAELDMAIG